VQQDFKTINRGALFVRQKYKETSPDVGGDIDLGGDVLEHIISEVNRGATQVKIGLIGYKRNTRNGTPMTSLTAVLHQEKPSPYQGGRMKVEDIPRQTQFPQQQRGGFNQNAYAQSRGIPQREATFEPRQRAGVSGGHGSMFTNDDLDKDDIPF